MNKNQRAARLRNVIDNAIAQSAQANRGDSVLSA